ncbi:MAG: ABC transporter substrate-binding protein, partial [Anaerolineaceae bacterium]
MSEIKRAGWLCLPVFFVLALLTGCAAANVQPTAPAASQTEPAQASTTAALTEQPAGFSVTDALGREVHFNEPPSRIVLAGRALFMVADAIYLFPEAGGRIIGLGQTNQGSGNFISLIDPDYEAKAVLEREAGAEQIAPLRPDAVILKSSLAQTLGSSIEALGVPVVYVDFETPEQYTRDLQILGTLLQNETRAAELVNLYQERLDAVAHKLEGLEPADRPRTLLLYASSEDGG